MLDPTEVLSLMASASPTISPSPTLLNATLSVQAPLAYPGLPMPVSIFLLIIAGTCGCAGCYMCSLNCFKHGHYESTYRPTYI